MNYPCIFVLSLLTLIPLFADLLVNAYTDQQLEAANKKFAKCCRQAGIDCIECKFGIDLKEGGIGCAINHRKAFVSCINDGQDHRECCRQKNLVLGGIGWFDALKVDCSNICDAEFDSLNPQYTFCKENGNDIKIRSCLVGGTDANTPTSAERNGFCKNEKECPH